jgi:integrase
MVENLTGLIGLRDKALLLVGFAGAFRRSELVAINCTDIEWVDQGMVVHIRRSKTDQAGEGRKVGLPFARGRHCPVLALKQWLEAANITSGFLFRSVTKHGHIGEAALSREAVAVIVKKRAQAIGLDSAKYSGHSLRAGLVTSAAQAGVSNWKIKSQTGHKSDAMLTRYIRDSQIFVDNAGGIL